MNYTNKEISIRLKELGFEMDAPVYHHAIRLYRHGEETYTGSNQPEPLYDYAPAYTSDQLFSWLRENKADITIKVVGMSGAPNVKLPEGSFPASHDYMLDKKRSLTDMLAKAVIWILEQ